jgi:hypothetical protein
VAATKKKRKHGVQHKRIRLDLPDPVDRCNYK